MWSRYSIARRAFPFIPIRLPPESARVGTAQCAHRRNVDQDADQPFQLQLDRGEVEQAGAVGGVDQQVEVAALGVITPDDGPEHPGIASLMSLGNAPNGRAMGLERL